MVASTPNGATGGTPGTATQDKLKIRIQDVLVFAAAATLLMIWFTRHVAGWWLAIAIFAVLGPLSAVIAWALHEEMKQLPGLLFGKWKLLRWYWVLMAAGAFLLATTRSVYLQYDPGTYPTIGQKHRMRWGLTGGRMTQGELCKEEKEISHPYFFQFMPRTVTVEVTDPTVYQTQVSESVWPWQSWTLKIPGDLKAREFHLVRLLPGPNLCAKLAVPGAAATAVFSLEVVKSGNSSPLCTAKDVRRQALVLGAADEQVKWALAREDVMARDKALAAVAGAIPLPNNAARQRLLATWQNSPPLATAELKAGDRLTMVLRLAQSAPLGVPPKEVWRKEVVVQPQPGVQDELVEDDTQL